MPPATSPNKSGARIGKALRVDDIAASVAFAFRANNAVMMIDGAGVAMHHESPVRLIG